MAMSTVKERARLFNPDNKTYVATVDGHGVWISNEPFRFFFYIVRPDRSYELYSISAVEQRTETDDLLDAVWTTLRLRGLA
mgnify:CR=1 FL=1